VRERSIEEGTPNPYMCGKCTFASSSWSFDRHTSQGLPIQVQFTLFSIHACFQTLPLSLNPFRPQQKETAFHTTGYLQQSRFSSVYYQSLESPSFPSTTVSQTTCAPGSTLSIARQRSGSKRNCAFACWTPLPKQSPKSPQVSTSFDNLRFEAWPFVK